MPNIFLEAYNFAKSPDMLDLDDVKAKQFANEYAKKCTKAGRLSQKFYDDAYDVAYNHAKLNIDDEDKRKQFVIDFALSCSPESLITDSVYSEIDNFARDSSMMNLWDEEARFFIYEFLLRCAKENYLTQENWNYVYEYALNNLNMGITEAEEFTRQFFNECQSFDAHHIKHGRDRFV